MNMLNAALIGLDSHFRVRRAVDKARLLVNPEAEQRVDLVTQYKTFFFTMTVVFSLQIIFEVGVHIIALKYFENMAVSIFCFGWWETGG